MTRAYTPEEVRDMLLDHAWAMIDYWEKFEHRSVRDRIASAVFSFLVALDGESADLPAFKVAPSPHPEDRDFHERNGERWFPEDEPDIGVMHDFFYQRPGAKR